ncbi:MAG: tail fiber domain-containing protein [Bdellovibrionota bacterium]
MNKKILSSVLALAAVNAQAVTTLTVPNSFSSGTSISSAAMNANFTAIQSFVNGSACLNDGTNCATNGTVTAITAGTGLVGGTITAAGTLAVDVGTAAGKIVQLNAAAQLPAVSGTLLTNINAANITAGTLPITNGGTGATTAATARTNLGVSWEPNGLNTYFVTGFVGIGNTSPTFPLQLQHNLNGTGISVQNSNSGAGAGTGIDFRSNFATNRIARITPSSTATVGGELQLQTSTDGSTFITPMVIKSDGKIGMGTLSPSQILSIHAPGVSGLPSQAFTQYTNGNTGTSGTDGLRVGYLDNVAQIFNMENSNISFGINGVEKMVLDINGDVQALGTFTTFSDVRLKKDFAPLTDVFGKLSHLHGYYYHWKNKSLPARQMGVKAQEVEKSFPEVVKTGKDGIKSVAYPQLVAPLIEAVNLLHKRVTVMETPSVRSPASESRIKKLETENAQLKAWICAKDASAPFCR